MNDNGWELAKLNVKKKISVGIFFYFYEKHINKFYGLVEWMVEGACWISF